MGPILLAIEAGHYATVSDRMPNQSDLICDRDYELWPCATMLAARTEQRAYAERPVAVVAQ